MRKSPHSIKRDEKHFERESVRLTLRVRQLEAALREIRGCAWVDKHGLERCNVLKIESILNGVLGPPQSETKADPVYDKLYAEHLQICPQCREKYGSEAKIEGKS